MLGRAPLLALAAALAGLVAGCGSGRSSPTASGRAVFAQQCSVCHSLAGNEHARKDGGDLLGFHATRSEVVQFVREMPVRRPLTKAQLQAVVDYVMAAERRAAGQ